MWSALKIPCHSIYGCFNIGISGPQTQYSKTSPKFSRGAVTATPNQSHIEHPPNALFRWACQGRSRRGVGVWPWAACSHSTMRSVYGGCIAMARRNPYYKYTRGQNCWYPSVNERKTHNGHWNNLKLTKVIINKNLLKLTNENQTLLLNCGSTESF